METIEEVIAQAVAVGACIKLMSFDDIEISGPRVIAPMAAKVISRKREAIDYLTLKHLAGDRHLPTTTLGRLARNLIPYWRGVKIQNDDRPIKNFKGMCEQLFAAIKSSEASEPGEELTAMIIAFKSILAAHTFMDPIDPKLQWPTEECPAGVKGTKADPNRDIKELPPPGLVRDDYRKHKKEVESEDIPF